LDSEVLGPTRVCGSGSRRYNTPTVPFRGHSPVSLRAFPARLKLRPATEPAEVFSRRSGSCLGASRGPREGCAVWESVGPRSTGSTEGFPLTWGLFFSILKFLRGVALGVSVCSPGPSEGCPGKGLGAPAEQATGCGTRENEVRRSQGSEENELPQLLTRTDLFGSG